MRDEFAVVIGPIIQQLVAGVVDMEGVPPTRDLRGKGQPSPRREPKWPVYNHGGAD
jgi:hypothetical protein